MNMSLQLITWYHRVKIAALVLVWIFFTYLLMSYDEKEIESRQMAVLPFESKGKLFRWYTRSFRFTKIGAQDSVKTCSSF